MPLLSYFVVVGSALIGLICLANAVLPHDDAPIYISSQIEGLPAPRKPQQSHDEPSSRLKSTTAFAAAPVATPQQVDEPQQTARDTPPPKKRKAAPRKRDWQDAYAQADNGWHDNRRWFDRGRRNDGWREQRGRDRGWRDRGWREPFWGSGWRGGSGWR